MKRKTRKKNPARVTDAWLKKRIALVNEMLGRPQAQYTKKADGGLTGNRGHLFIDNAYGGVKVAEMAGNGTGENDISNGYVPKRELNNFIDGMIAAVRLMERGKNPVRKKATRKKNPKRSAKSHLWQIALFQPHNHVIYFYGGVSSGRIAYTQQRAKGILFKTKKLAADVAETIPEFYRSKLKFNVAVVPENMTLPQLRKGLGITKEKA